MSVLLLVLGAAALVFIWRDDNRRRLAAEQLRTRREHAETVANYRRWIGELGETEHALNAEIRKLKAGEVWFDGAWDQDAVRAEVLRLKLARRDKARAELAAKGGRQ